MLAELVRLVGCLAVGEVLSRAGLPFPAPVIGLLVLYLNLLALGRLPPALGSMADTVLGLFGMLFVPAGVGVLAYVGLFRAELLPVVAALLGGTIVTFMVTVFVADRLLRLEARHLEPAKEAADVG